VKRWLTPMLGGQKWTVYLVSPKSKHLGSKDECLYGKCDYERCRIYINRTLDAALLEDTLLHELLHAILFVSGGEKVYGCDGEKDEVLVTAVTPILHRLLKDLGFVFPNAMSP
jgi:hypothetical protein